MIQVTPAAAHEMRRLLAGQGPRQGGLRVGVKGGGCSGLSYTMRFEEKPGEHDKVFEVDGVRIFCDPQSQLYLSGLTLDYTHELMGGGFRFINPAAARDRLCASPSS